MPYNEPNETNMPALSGKLIEAVRGYVDAHFVAEFPDISSHDASQPLAVADGAPEKIAYAAPAVKTAESLEDMVGRLDESFSETLMRLIDVKGIKDSEVYNRANIDRRLFSKIRSNAHYVPKKATVLTLAVALELTLAQTVDLLERAGFALTHSRKFDVIIEYFLLNQIYDIYQINTVLYSYDQPLLGG